MLIDINIIQSNILWYYNTPTFPTWQVVYVTNIIFFSNTDKLFLYGHYLTP